MRNVSLDVDDRRLDDVISQVGKGKYRIPEFQREFVWDRADVVDLFDSIYKSYPIGSFFFWRVPHDMWNFFRDVDELNQPPLDEIQRSEFPEISFVLDSQQRLTSLYVTLNGMTYADTDYSRIVFDLDKETFKIAEGKGDHLVRVCDIWDDKRAVRDDLEGERYEAFTDCNDALTKYELPLIIVKTNEVESVINIFERINQKGTRLSRFDIVNANIWSQDFNLRSRIDEDIFEHLDEMVHEGYLREWADQLDDAVEGVEYQVVDVPEGEAAMPDDALYDSGRSYEKNVARIDRARRGQE